MEGFMLSRDSLRTFCSRAKNAFQALRVVSFAVVTTAGADIWQRFMRYFFPDTEPRNNAPMITHNTAPLPPLRTSPPPSQPLTNKAIAAKQASQIVAVVRKIAGQNTPISSQLFYHSASPPLSQNNQQLSKVAKFT